MSDTGAGRREPSLPKLLGQLADDGARWAEAELALARAEASGLARRWAAGIAAALAATAASIAALVVLAQAAVAALTPVLESESLAGLIAAIALVVCVAALLLFARRMLTAPTRAPFSGALRWMDGAKLRRGAAE